MISYIQVDCIVAPVSHNLLKIGSGLNSRLHDRAGPELKQELCSSGHILSTTQAKLTKAYNLPSTNYIIHTVGPLKSSKSDELPDVRLENTYVNCLDTADQSGEINSIAFPNISTGAYAFSVEQASEIAFKTSRKWLTKRSKKLKEVVFICSNKVDYDIYNKLFLNNQK